MSCICVKEKKECLRLVERGLKGMSSELKRAKLLAKWQIDQGFQRKSLSPCGLRCLYFYNGVFREALNNMSPKT